jgi:hypothetical protein
VADNSNAGALYKNPFLDFATPVLSKSPALEPRFSVLVRTANARKEVTGAADSLGDVIFPGKETSERGCISMGEVMSLLFLGLSLDHETVIDSYKD